MKIIVVVLLLMLSIFLNAQQDIYGKWDAILKDNVIAIQRQDILFNAIDYDRVQKDNRFKEIVSLLGTFDPAILPDHNARLAFWVNTYNIGAVKMIIDHDISGSIKDIGNLLKPVWKFESIMVGGRYYTLHEIEHEILRPMKQPLIHFAIVCASLSCPDLLIGAYFPETIISQMEQNTGNFLKNETKGMQIDMKKNKVYLSMIFKWFEADFNDGISEFIETYSGHDISRYKIKYLKYDWRVNSLKPGRK
jgi:uncharacterized protein DUF547